MTKSHAGRSVALLMLLANGFSAWAQSSSTVPSTLNDYLPGRLLGYAGCELRAKCAELDVAGRCKSFHVFEHQTFTDGKTTEKQLTAFPIFPDFFGNQKLKGFGFNLFGLSNESITQNLYDDEKFWIPLSVPADVLGYTLATPIYWIVKPFHNLPYNKFEKAMRRGQVRRLSRGHYDQIHDALCSSGYHTRRHQLAARLGYEDVTRPGEMGPVEAPDGVDFYQYQDQRKVEFGRAYSSQYDDCGVSIQQQ